MKVIKGIGIGASVCEGKIRILRFDGPVAAERRTVEDPKAEAGRLAQGLEKAKARLEELYLKTKNEAGEDAADVFHVQKMMLCDPDFVEPIQEMVLSQSFDCAYALDVCSKELAGQFRAMDDPYMRQRAADVLDAASLALEALGSETTSGLALEEPVIVCSDDLTPSQTMRLEKDKVLALVLRRGSLSSHASIIAQSRGIACIVGLGDGFSFLKDGMDAIVDSGNGIVALQPDDAARKRCALAIGGQLRREEAAQRRKNEPAITRAGWKVLVAANVGGVEEAREAADEGADGIGLLRSEFLFMGVDEAPDEETQFAWYKEILQLFPGKGVIVRTLDIGADKKIPYLGQGAEANPALGKRGIRLSLSSPELFRTQLRALVRASSWGRLSIMFPMVSFASELRRAKEILRSVMDETRCASEIRVGVMIETPAAALQSAELAREADFFSIGTNDLTQYTLALDRMNGDLAPMFDCSHPAVDALVRMAVGNAHAASIPCGICGQSASDPRLLASYLSYHVDELSVPAKLVPKLKESIRRI